MQAAGWNHTPRKTGRSHDFLGKESTGKESTGKGTEGAKVASGHRSWPGLYGLAQPFRCNVGSTAEAEMVPVTKPVQDDFFETGCSYNELQWDLTFSQ
eukprot:1157819-Pelagomonas_calceolata.AAC.4